MGADIQGWTVDEVERQLVSAFRALSHAPVFSPAPDVLLPQVQANGATAIELIGLTARYLGIRSAQRVALLTWARAKAGGPPARAVCREMGWERNVFLRRRQAAARVVAAALNRDGVPTAPTTRLTTHPAALDAPA